MGATWAVLAGRCGEGRTGAMWSVIRDGLGGVRVGVRGGFGVVRGKKMFSNRTSQVVPHLSTNRSCPCLTSQIERDAVLSRKYGRTCQQWGGRSIMYRRAHQRISASAHQPARQHLALFARRGARRIRRRAPHRAGGARWLAGADRGGGSRRCLVRVGGKASARKAAGTATAAVWWMGLVGKAASSP